MPTITLKPRLALGLSRSKAVGHADAFVGNLDFKMSFDFSGRDFDLTTVPVRIPAEWKFHGIAE
jgi:hypothetical protein